jgi:hypothetical protein
MTLAEMEQSLEAMVQDSSLRPQFARMLNDALLEIAGDFDLPALERLTPLEFPVTTSGWIFPLSETFHKKLFHCVNGVWSPVTIHRHLGMAALDHLDRDHDEVGEHVTHVAVRDTGMDKYLGIFPKADDTLRLWFYEKPAQMKKPDDMPRCLPAEYHDRVLVTKCILKNFQMFTDYIEDGPQKSLVYWENQYNQGLYGARSGDIGLINFLAKARGGPRRHGGRDPIGGRGY